MATRPAFRGRADAGRAVAGALGPIAAPRDAVVLGLARGGVPIARPVADALGAPLDVLVARKLGVPGVREVALGAIAEGSERVVGDSVGWYIGVPPDVVARIAARERAELERRVRLYRGGRPIPDVRGRTVVLVDDGLATGATLRAAARALRRRRPARLVVAVPVASAVGCEEVRAEVDELVAVLTPERFGMVSDWYEDFSAVSDAEVLRLLGRAAGDATGGSDAPRGDARDERAVTIPVDDGSLAGDLGLPDDAPYRGAALAVSKPRGLAVLAHGGGSSRNSYRNRYLAGRLRLAGFATLRLDLLTAAEQMADAERGELRFDVGRIARRLTAVTEWAAREGVPGAERIVLMGASTGAAAALLTAAERPTLVAGVAARGGRVDLAGEALTGVRAPALLIVGGADRETLRWNRQAMQWLPGAARLVVIHRAGHTFEEPGALGAVGEHVVEWLERLPEARQGQRGWRWPWHAPPPVRIAEIRGAPMVDRLASSRPRLPAPGACP